MNKNILQTTNPAVTIPVFILGLIVIAYGVYRLDDIEEKYAEIIAKEKNASNVILNSRSIMVCRGKNRKGYAFKAKSNVTGKTIKGEVCCESGVVSFGANCRFR